MEEKKPTLLFLLSTRKYSYMYHVCAPETQTALTAYFSGLFTFYKSLRIKVERQEHAEGT